MQLKNYIRDLRGFPGIIRKLSYLPGAIADPNGFGFLNLMFDNARIPNKYRYMFIPDENNAVFLDCGANVGLVTDIARFMDMEVYAFEPNPVAVRLLRKKYKDDEKTHVYGCAVSDKEGEMDFYQDSKILFDQGASIIEEFANNNHVSGGKRERGLKVKVKRLTDVIKNDVLKKHGHIHMLKIDIEGAEFGVLNDLIQEKLYKNITYIVVETHEAFFDDGEKKLSDLNNKIKNNGIKNIYLDWV